MLRKNQDEMIERERRVLQHIVQTFVLTANPVGSRTISRDLDLNLSAATIRNIMSDLEAQGYITHPHTSAGRVPTDKGYRYYVDSIMRIESLTDEEQQMIEGSIDQARIAEVDEIFKESSRLLSKITRQISIVSLPHFEDGILQRIELLPLASTRVMTILTIASGFVKSMMFEIDTVIEHGYLQGLATMMNERLAGLTLKQIRETFAERLRDASNEKSGLVRLFVSATDKLFSSRSLTDRVHIDGVQGITQQPEFERLESIRSIIELLEDERIIVHILDSHERSEIVSISIGSEIPEDRMHDFSMITSTYTFGTVQGTLGIIGPKRMQYSKLASAVEYISRLISQKYSM